MTRLLTATAILLATGAAVAMSEIDADADGMLSMSELMAAYPDLTEADFAAADADGNGAIDATELADARAAGTLPDDQG